MQLSSHTTRASWSSTLSVRNLGVSLAVSLLREPLRQSLSNVALMGGVSGRNRDASGAASLRRALTVLMGVRRCESGRVEDIGPALQHVAPHAQAHDGVERQSIPVHISEQGKMLGRLRWVLACSVALTLFGNHYARDSVASLEWQMEDQLDLSPIAYNRAPRSRMACWTSGLGVRLVEP